MQPLKEGDSGGAVRRLQRLLEGAPVTGTYRETTTEAVKRFQREHELEPTGEFSPQLLGLFEDDRDAAFPDRVEPQPEEGTRADDASATTSGGGGTSGDAGLDELGSSGEGGGASSDKVKDALGKLFTSLTSPDGQSGSGSQGGGGRFANGQGPYASGSGSGSGQSGSSGKALGGSATGAEDPLAHINQRGSSTPGSQSGSQTASGGSQTGSGGSQTGSQGGGSQGGGSQSGGGGSQTGSQGGGSQSQGGGQSGQDDVFTSENLPFREFDSLKELATALEILKTIEQIQEALGQGTVEEALVQKMRTLQGKLTSSEAKALIDAAIKVYEIPTPSGKKVYLQPALTALLKAKAVEIGAVPTGPGAGAPTAAQAAHDRQITARFPGLK
ncbi:MAG: peptidoglycan-binding domain-containing protein [Planctomycetota bacterium]